MLIFGLIVVNYLLVTGLYWISLRRLHGNETPSA